jgi:hypothetical protein
LSTSVISESARRIRDSGWVTGKLEEQTRKLLFGDIHYLRDSRVVVEGVKFWGTAWIPPYAGVFNLPEDELREKWQPIPSDTDVLITHGPHAGILDGGAGSSSLAAALQRIQPAIHCFGHVHEHRGQVKNAVAFDRLVLGIPYYRCAARRSSQISPLRVPQVQFEDTVVDPTFSRRRKPSKD